MSIKIKQGVTGIYYVTSDNKKELEKVCKKIGKAESSIRYDKGREAFVISIKQKAMQDRLEKVYPIEKASKSLDGVQWHVEFEREKTGDRKTDKTNINKKRVLEALEDQCGVVTAACKIVGVSRTQFYVWMEEDDEFKKAVDDVSEVAKDFVESSLFLQIKGGNTAATIFYLKTKAKDRGYVERQEIEEIRKMPDLSDWTDEQIRAELARADEEKGGD